MEFITTDQRIATENFRIGKIYTITFKDSSSITRACIGKGADYVMFQEEAPKMLFTLNMQTASTIDTIEIGGGGSGTTDYDDLDNKPKINNVTLSGNKTSSDLGLQDAISAENPISASYVSGLATVATTGAYSDLSGLPTLGTAAAAAATDFATAAQGSKADAADTAISTAATGFASLDARLDSMDTTISGKQGALSSTQLDAVNSGIDSTKVQQIATNTTAISGKQDTLTTAQLAAANSGITSAGVAQIETNKTNILLLETMNGAKNLAPFNSGAHTGNAMYWFAHPNCIDIAENTSVYLVFDYTQTSGQYSVQLTNANGDALTSTLAYTTSNTTSGHVVKKVTVPSGITAKGYSSYHNTNATVTISNFMIVPAEIYEAGFTDYQPYAMSNVELTAAIQAIQAQLANS